MRSPLAAGSPHEIVRRLGAGGMAEIYLARRRDVSGAEDLVVLKVMHRERRTDREWIDMFLDEAMLGLQLDHPNIARVHDVGRTGDAYFLAMEYVDGFDLMRILKRAAQLRCKVPLDIALALATGVAAALAYVHDRADCDGTPLGIVHRDVSPSNVMLTYGGDIKLLDFGVAKIRARHSRTRAGAVKGKPGYMSPEQCLGRSLDHRSDIFSLGTLLYELCTTTRLWHRASSFEMGSAIVRERPRPPSEIRAEVPAALDAVILRALAKDPAERFQSCGELGNALAQVATWFDLSTSADRLSRYVHELFGPRTDEQEADTTRFERSSARPRRERVAMPALSVGETKLAWRLVG